MNNNVSVFVVDAANLQASATANFSYDPPKVQFFQPQVLTIAPGQPPTPATVEVYGADFGNFELAHDQNWSPFEQSIAVSVAGLPSISVVRTRGLTVGDVTGTIVTATIDPTNLPCGGVNFTIFIAGQVGVTNAWEPAVSNVTIIPFDALVVACGPGFFGHVGETCLPCPAQFPSTPALTGASCEGYSVITSTPYAERFTYPVPLAGWYNLNSSDANTAKWGPGQSQMLACPAGFQSGSRDVCIAPCDPADSCIGNNFCAYGYASKPPLWRCAYCDTGFYESAGACIKCPDSPWALVVGFVLIVIVAGCLGYFMNQKGVNIAVISIGLDFFQVLAIFADSGVKWPAVIQQLFQVLSAFNLNIEIVAPQCIVPDISYKQEFAFIMLLPLFVGSLLGLIFVGIWAYKALIMGAVKKEWFTHRPALIASTLALLYILYLYLTRTVFNIFNCSPSTPPDDCLHLSVAGGECCGKPGGTQVTLLPYAVAGLIVYSFGYPIFIGWTLYKNHKLAMLDQILKAKGTGDDKLTNPLAYELRMTYGRSYFQFKPDYCMWILAIICRKFFIAITGAVFGKNSSFQMAACLMIMFLAYSAQMIFRPYMNSGEFENVLRSHHESSFTNATHAEISRQVANIETRGRKKARKNLLNFEGKVDRSAVLGVLTGWLFNYNTIEQIMLFCAVVVCLMGIMYEANVANDTYAGADDGITAVVIIDVVFALIYYFTMLFTEMAILFNESARTRQLEKAAARLGSKGATNKAQADRGADPRHTGGRLVDDEGELNVGKVEAQNNPLFTSTAALAKSGASGGGGGGDVGLEALLGLRHPPPEAVWQLFQSQVREIDAALQLSRSQVAELKRAAAQGTQGGDEAVGGSTAPHIKRAKAEFAPRASAAPKLGAAQSSVSTLGGSGGGGVSNLASLRRARKASPLAEEL